MIFLCFSLMHKTDQSTVFRFYFSNYEINERNHSKVRQQKCKSSCHLSHYQRKKPILLSGTLFLPQKAQNRALLQINEDNKTSNCWRWIPTQKGGFINIGFLFFTFYGISGSKYFVDLSVMYVNKYFRKFIFRWQTWSALPFLFPSPPPVPSPWSQTPQQINTQKSHFPQRLNEHTKTNIFRYWKQHFHREYSL